MLLSDVGTDVISYEYALEHTHTHTTRSNACSFPHLVLLYRYRLALRSHLQNVDELIRLQQARIKALSDEYNFDVGVLKKEFNKEQVEILARHAREKQEIAAILESVQLES